MGPIRYCIRSYPSEYSSEWKGLLGYDINEIGSFGKISDWMFVVNYSVRHMVNLKLVDDCNKLSGSWLQI